MRIKLSNFRKWSDITFNLDSGITKITGESGMGKSTIFDAIYWCLYGKLRSVSSKNSTGRTEVIIDMLHPNVQVHRWGMRNVSITIGDQQYTGDVAQGKIDECFGNHDMFMMTSYLRAESIHPLIISTPTEKRELTSLLFPESSKYDTYKSKLSRLRYQDEQSIASIDSKIISLSSSISTLESINPWLKEYVPIDIASPTTTERELINRIGQLSKDKDSCMSILATYRSYNDQLATLPSPIDTTSLNDELSQLRDRLTRSMVYSMSKSDRLQLLHDRLSNIVLPDDMSLSRCEELLSICNKLLSIATSISSIEDKIKVLNDKYNTDSITLEEYEKSLEDIEYNAKISTVLECPKCNTRLRYCDKLSVYDGDIVPRVVKHSISRSDINRLRLSLERIDTDRKNTYSIYNTYNDILSSNDILKDKDISSYRSTLLSYIDMYRTKESIDKEIVSIDNDNREYISIEDRTIIDDRINTIVSTLDSNNNVIYTHNRLSSSLSSLLDNNKWLSDGDKHIDDINNTITSLKQELHTVKNMKDRARIYNMYMSNKNELSLLSTSIEDIKKRIDDSHKLDHILAQSYNEYVGERLREIEYDISILGKCFFDDTMNITLTACKESINGTIKPSFDINIDYMGSQYDDVRMMSTGEKKRLSIILMMVLSKYTDGKMMLLDEAFTSVGIDCRGVMLSELGKMNIPIYITSHDDIIGGYSAELDINQTK